MVREAPGETSQEPCDLGCSHGGVERSACLVEVGHKILERTQPSMWCDRCADGLVDVSAEPF